MVRVVVLYKQKSGDFKVFISTILYTKMNGKNYSINEMIANKSSWSYNPKRQFENNQDKSEIWIPFFLLCWRRNFYAKHNNAKKMELMTWFCILLLTPVRYKKFSLT